MQWKICSICGKPKEFFIRYKDGTIICSECCRKSVGSVLEKWLEMIHKEFFKNGKYK